MPGIEAVRNTPAHTPRDEEYTPLSAPTSKQNTSLDTLEIKGSGAPSPSKAAEILSSIWQWMTTPFAGGALPVAEEAKISAIAPSSPLPRPQSLPNPAAEKAVQELKAAFQDLQAPLEVPKGSKDMWAVAEYKVQSELYEEGIVQARERFAAKQKLKKAEEKEYVEARKEFNQIGKDTQWWQNANQYAMYAVAGITSLAALYAFGTANVGEGVGNALTSAFKVGLPLVGGTSAVTTIAKGNLEYKGTVRQGELTVLSHKKKVSEIHLYGLIDFLSNSYSKYGKIFGDMHTLGETWRQTSKSFYS